MEVMFHMQVKCYFDALFRAEAVLQPPHVDGSAHNALFLLRLIAEPMFCAVGTASPRRIPGPWGATVVARCVKL